MSDTIKVVINNDYGYGFNISDDVAEKLLNEYGWELVDSQYSGEAPIKSIADVSEKNAYVQSEKKYGIPIENNSKKDFRTHNDLIDVIESVGEEKSSGYYSSLRIVEIPADIDWEIVEIDGKEHIAEKHRKWGHEY